MENVNCTLCGNEQTTFLFNGRDYDVPSPERFSLVQCDDCGLAFVNPRPAPEEMGRYYPDEYHLNYGGKSRELEFLHTKKSRIVGRFRDKGRLLDIGCQKGTFLKEMETKGWDVYGVDISRCACDYARQEMDLKNIYHGDLLSLDLPEGYFDVITLWEVVEHLRDPLTILKKVRKLLKKDGTLIIECPNFSSVTSLLFRDKWQPLDVPRHLYQFTPRTIKEIAKRADFSVWGTDYFTSPLMSLVSVKVTVMRWLNIEAGQDAKSENNPGEAHGSEKRNIIWRGSRAIFTFVCFCASLFLALCRKGDIVCIYCQPNK